MNTQHEKLKDIRVRKAIQRAIDVKSILDAAYGGAASAGPWRCYRWASPATARRRNTPTTRTKPRALLKEAGVSDLTLEFKTLNEAYRVTAAQIVQANLADVGIKVDIIPLDSGPFWNLGLESKGEDWKTLQMWWMRYRMLARSLRRHPVVHQEPGRRVELGALVRSGIRRTLDQGPRRNRHRPSATRSICACRRSWRIPAPMSGSPMIR